MVDQMEFYIFADFKNLIMDDEDFNNDYLILIQNRKS